MGLGLLAWLSRMSIPRSSAVLELDPSYQQVLGVALKQGLRFGRDIVFTSGPLAYFRQSPFDPDLYGAKLWLWEVLLGAACGLLLFARLVRRGTWIDVGVGALVLIVLPRSLDEWVFVTALLAADLALEAIDARAERVRPWRRRSMAALALVLLSILTLIKVTGLTLALGALALLVLHAAARCGWRTGLLWAAGWVVVEVLLWAAIGQRPQDLPAYFASSLELASGFDAAMSMAARTRPLVLGITCLLAGLALCGLHARRSGGRWFSNVARVQAALVALALVLAYKAGFTRADHAATLFGTAAAAPLFLLPLASSGSVQLDRARASLRGAVAVLAALCGFTAWVGEPLTPPTLARLLLERVQASLAWLRHPEEVRDYLARSRAELADNFGIPRVEEIVGERGISAFALGDPVVFLEGLRWQPRPVFTSFSVLTMPSARRNAEFVAAGAPDFVLLRSGTIDRRLPSSEDPLVAQALLRDYSPRFNEGGFLLLERAATPREEQRETCAGGTLGWGERLELPAGDAPLVLRARIRPSLFGRARAALYQSPPVRVQVELVEGGRDMYRIAPFALEAGVVLRPWLPTNAAWIARARGERAGVVASLRFFSPVPSAFEPRIEYSLERAEDLRAIPVSAAIQRDLLLGAVGELPLSFESPVEPELASWVDAPMMLLVHAPATLRYAAGPGRARLTGRLLVPPWIADAQGFPGVLVEVRAREGDAVRECTRFEVGFGAEAGSRMLDLDQEVTLDAAGSLELSLRAPPGGDPELAAIGMRRLRVKR